MPRLRLVGVAGALAALACAFGAVPASASVTLGQLAPAPSGGTSGVDFIQLAVGSGNSYVVPENGTITSWSTNAGSGPSQSADLKVFRKFADPAFYTVAGLDGPHSITANIVNTFSSSVKVQAGDLIGLGTIAGAVT